MTARELLLQRAREAVARHGHEASILLYLAGTGNRNRRLEARRGAPWGELDESGEPGYGTYRFCALDVIDWLEKNP